ncbi:hypothetical protein EDEG_04178 [Edhazardia aedis USNM 41457]|uniref:Uncharacterized protein n=1 Tax=Edhazardia aedis (strain USNM 41457) TaxID=1003232 RepID=J9DQM9_EDHAE|nr:hypothetical protein EDEG_04178 [Edhazardia aedis USNM 41457]|eukprot:EJW04870.1 hypothetical protein EDEG_04178 [Edhazardia aedis USNM 41457]
MLCYIIGHENVFIMRVLNSNFLLIKRNLDKILQFADQWSYSKNLPYTYFSHSHIAQFKYHINNLNLEWYLHIESVYGHLKKSYNYGVLKKRMMILCTCRDNNAREFAFVDFFSVKIAEEEDNDDLKSDVLHDKV